MAAVDIESVIKKGVEQALNKPILNGKSVLEWAAIGMGAPQVVRCKDCKHWDKTTREEGNDCISGPWEDAVCEVFRDWDSYGDLGEHFRRTNGDWFCGDGEVR